MSSNINDFDKELRLFAQVKLPEDHTNLVKKVSMQALTGVVNKTPVDTGRARSNWMTAVNEVPSDTIALTADLSRAEASAESINRGTTIIDSLKPYSTVNIANNLPYILPLEYGGSKQAPLGMARVTVAEIEAAFK